MIVSTPALLVLLLAGHFLADYPLQGEFLAEGKNRHTMLGRTWWPHALTAHAAIQAGVVTGLTGSASLGVCEFVIHWATDWLTCEKRIDRTTDQAIHLLCKFVWWTIVLYWRALI